MNHLRHFAARMHATVECAVIGSGGFGRSFLSHARLVRGLSCRVAVDRDAAIARDTMLGIGIEATAIATCTTAAEAEAAFAAGKYLACADASLVMGLPIQVVLEATGNPEAGARHALMAIEARKHVVMVTKETDSVVGPILAQKARANGVVVTPVDGDQPSLLIGLATWAEINGLTIIAAGKSSEYDFVFDPARGEITSNGTTIAVPGFDDWLEIGGRDLATVSAERARLCAALPQRAVPDLCEMTLVANHLGYMPDVAALHAPIARITEVADFMARAADGGLLSGDGRLDVFHCLRLPGEPSFAGGVFVTVPCEDEISWQMLAEKGHVMARNGKTAMLALPRHMLGLEAATSVFEAALLGMSSGVDSPRAVVDLTAHADVDLPAGLLLEARGHHHTIAGVSARMTPAAALGPDTAIPYYLASGRRLKHAVPAGRALLCGDVEMDESACLTRLRRAQDAFNA